MMGRLVNLPRRFLCRPLGRAITVLVVVLLLACLTCIRCSADSASQDVDGILEEFKELLPDDMKGLVSDSGSLSDAVGFEALFGEIAGAVLGEGSRVLAFFLFLFGCSVLLSIVSLIEGKHKNLCCAAASGVVAVGVYNNVVPVISEIAAALRSATDFFSGISATLTAATLAGGGSSEASVGAVGVGLSVSAVSAVSEAVLMSLVGGMFSLSVVSSLDDGASGSISKCIKSVFTWGVGVITTLFGATLSLQRIVAGAQDSAAMRAAKYAASGMIPVVGGAVSGALTTLASGVSYVKSIMGAASVAVLLTILLSPLVMLLLYKLAFFLCNLFLELTGADHAGSIIRAMSGAFDALIAVYALSGAIYVFQIVLFVKGGVALL